MTPADNATLTRQFVVNVIVTRLNEDNNASVLRRRRASKGLHLDKHRRAHHRWRHDEKNKPIPDACDFVAEQ
jgi:hypothetical protein